MYKCNTFHYIKQKIPIFELAGWAELLRTEKSIFSSYSSFFHKNGSHFPHGVNCVNQSNMLLWYPWYVYLFFWRFLFNELFRQILQRIFLAETFWWWKPVPSSIRKFLVPTPLLTATIVLPLSPAVHPYCRRYFVHLGQSRHASKRRRLPPVLLAKWLLQQAQS